MTRPGGNPGPAAPEAAPPSTPGRGRFVAFEGIDGSGKSTCVARVAEALRAEGIDVAATREETHGVTGDWVRRSVQERWDPLATTFLFLADRARHVQEIEAWRAAGRHVLCDRYADSTFAYQGVTLARAGRFSAPEEAVPFLRALHEGWCPLPDRVLLFTCDPAAAVRRVQGRGATTPYEKAAFLGEVQQAYLALARRDPGRFTVIDSDRPIGEVASDAEAEVRRLLA
ncbi:MAG TPA: dTMP kinase [Candidatus Thermoplasmatota archaeon]|nr:dTMP kinase [Candidatus Thermoplasmatota archaeon]